MHLLFLNDQSPITLEYHAWKSSKLKGIIPLSVLRLIIKSENYTQQCKNKIFELTMVLFSFGRIQIQVVLIWYSTIADVCINVIIYYMWRGPL